MTGGVLATLFGDPFAVMNTVGLVAFALVGASKAVREEFDLFGVAVVGLAMAFAGGVTRDLLVARVPLALRSPVEILLGLLGVALAVGLSAWLASPDEHPVTLVADAVGLAAFATTGAIVATDAGVSAFGVVAVATINAVGGGALADILLDRSPFILFEDFYASCAVLGGIAYWLVGVLGGPSGVVAAACAAVTVGLRLVAVARGWRLPTAKGLGDGFGR
ncbi:MULTISPECIES: trimeric intracellular cation channel family protein [unclassified Halorubrum]|uniref:trimeric intracellular cation channel family protein n=1 Tax=unclassified Halorubrum TaxID=2642239 RepID=UPI0010F51ED5|nr:MULTISPECIES: TRIC cation channel family protein [unclassified Halorubrum]TKX46106.1 trimeric intracellular cation channel family protein [Halorubrum sp. ARQ200]TKX50053.1 trimeric intracellular cation channel family protein [Halorubrum sp. ASP121]